MVVERMARAVGVCSWTFGSLPLPEILRLAAELGLDGVELQGDLEVLDRWDARALLAELGLALYSMTPANVDIATPDEEVRSEALRYYRRLVRVAAELSGASGARPLVSCHGLVGRVRAVSSQDEEMALLVASLREICAAAAEHGVTMVLEVLNRYESHLVNTCEQALEVLGRVAAPNLRVLLDAYHMNIEEPDPVAALRRAGEGLGLYHVADSNRRGIGRGHSDIAAQLAALDEIGYGGPVIIECSAPGPDPFRADKGGNYLEVLCDDLRQSLARLRGATGQVPRLTT